MLLLIKVYLCFATKVLSAFPDIVGVDKVKFNLPENLHPEWVSGFVAGDGGFSIGILLRQKIPVKSTLDFI